MHQEGDQRGGRGEVDDSIIVAAATDKGIAEAKVAKDAEAGTESVDAIDHIDGVDDAHTAEDGKWHSDPPAEIVDAP